MGMKTKTVKPFYTEQELALRAAARSQPSFGGSSPGSYRRERSIHPPRIKRNRSSSTESVGRGPPKSPSKPIRTADPAAASAAVVLSDDEQYSTTCSPLCGARRMVRRTKSADIDVMPKLGQGTRSGRKLMGVSTRTTNSTMSRQSSTLSNQSLLEMARHCPETPTTRAQRRMSAGSGCSSDKDSFATPIHQRSFFNRLGSAPDLHGSPSAAAEFVRAPPKRRSSLNYLSGSEDESVGPVMRSVAWRRNSLQNSGAPDSIQTPVVRGTAKRRNSLQNMWNSPRRRNSMSKVLPSTSWWSSGSSVGSGDDCDFRVKFPEECVETLVILKPFMTEEDKANTYWSAREIRRMAKRAQKVADDAAWKKDRHLLTCIRFCYDFSADPLLEHSAAYSSKERSISYGGMTNETALQYFFQFKAVESNSLDPSSAPSPDGKKDCKTTLRGLEVQISSGAIDNYRMQHIQDVLTLQALTIQDKEVMTKHDMKQLTSSLRKKSLKSSSRARNFAKLVAQADAAVLGIKTTSDKKKKSKKSKASKKEDKQKEMVVKKNSFEDSYDDDSDMEEELMVLLDLSHLD